jgi:hypothetical protein
MRRALCQNADLSSDIRTRRIWSRGGLDHKELAGRLAATQQLDRGVQLGAPEDGSMALGRTCNAPAFTAEKKARCDMKFVKWLVRKNRALTMARASLTIGLVVCQGMLMSTKRTLTSLGCGDSSMVALHVEAG